MQNVLSRRRLVSLIGGGGVGGVTGCLSTIRGSQTRIGEIVFINMDTTAHSVSVALSEEGTTVFERTVEVPPRAELQPVVTQDDGLPTASAAYKVRAELGAGSDSISRTVPDGSGGECYSVTVRIDSDGLFRDMPTDSTFTGCS